jgi:hypothetical protein
MPDERSALFAGVTCVAGNSIERDRFVADEQAEISVGAAKIRRRRWV